MTDQCPCKLFYDVGKLSLVGPSPVCLKVYSGFGWCTSLFMTLANPGKNGYCADRNSKESRTSKA